MKRFLFLVILAVFAMVCLPHSVGAQEKRYEPMTFPANRLIQLGGGNQPQQEEEPEAEKKQDDEKEQKPEEPTIDTAANRLPAKPVDPKMIRLHMWDGSVVSGQVAVDAIHVETEFGNLTIPIQRIVQFHPGLNTLGDVDQKIQELVEQLGSRDFDEREAAHRELAEMGPRLQRIIEKFDDGGSAERKKHLEQIKQEIIEQIDEMDGMDEAEQKPFIEGDTVQTPDFTIVGKIVESSFKIQTKYGLLDVSLKDIKSGERNFGSQVAQIRKQVTIDARAFWQSNPVSTRIRVNRGDKISINASGVVVWQNWGNLSSTPDGISNQGSWRNIQCGTLIARIGKSNDPIRIGSRGEFVAKTSGVLQLCIAMQDNYANNNGYRWNGEYKARVIVKPAAK